jgi:hypothetical protein
MIRSLAISGVLLFGGAGVAGEPSTLVRWSSPEPIAGEIMAMAEQGVEIRINEQVIPQMIPWFDVRNLTGPVTGLGGYTQLAEVAWRAHVRLERGDYSGAEVLYEELADRYLWDVGGQSSDVSLGLIRCRLDRGDRVGAVEPFLSWLLASQYFAPREWQDSDPIGFDAQYGVFVDLPPVFGPSVQGRELDALPESDRITPRQRVLYGYYQLALNQSVHRTSDGRANLDRIKAVMRDLDGRSPGVEFFADMVVAQAHPDAQQRLAARASLERRIRAHTDTWIELWARLGLGVSLLGEEGTQSNELGVIELIHVIVRLDHLSHPLAVLASELADDYLIHTDRQSWGEELRLAAQSAGLDEFESTNTKERTAHE